jgi:hypothetical protein
VIFPISSMVFPFPNRFGICNNYLKDVTFRWTL